jgi:hypothetical protein
MNTLTNMKLEEEDFDIDPFSEQEYYPSNKTHYQHYVSDMTFQEPFTKAPIHSYLKSPSLMDPSRINSGHPTIRQEHVPKKDDMFYDPFRTNSSYLPQPMKPQESAAALFDSQSDEEKMDSMLLPDTPVIPL